MSTFQNVSITKYINNWYPYYYPSGPPSDLPTTVAEGTITADTLSFIDSDAVTIMHKEGYYVWFAQKLLTIQFTTPNDGVSHVYNVGVDGIVTGPPPDYPWPCPTCSAGDSYNIPAFDIDLEIARFVTGSNYWDGYNPNTDCYSLGFGSSYGVISIGRNGNSIINPGPWGNEHYGPNGSLTLLPNTTYRLQCDLITSDSSGHVGVGGYFDYSANLYVYCADFGAGIGTGNLEMISEMN
jgi:hypothetical protein